MQKEKKEVPLRQENWNGFDFLVHNLQAIQIFNEMPILVYSEYGFCSVRKRTVPGVNIGFEKVCF